MNYIVKAFFVSTIAVSAAFSQERNAFKFNLLSPVSKIWTVQYEYKLSDRLSINNTFFYRKEGKIPFGTQLDKIAKSRGLGITGVDFQYIFIDEAEIGVLGYSPEIRYYLSDNKNPWFVGGFAQFEKFDMTVPAEFQVRYDGFFGNIKLPIAFDISTISGGILIGKQYNFNRLFLDFVIIGPHFGRARKVDAEINESLLNRLSESDKEFLRQSVIDRFKLNEDYFNVGVADERASINAKRNIPYFGIRGVGLNLGYRF